MIRPLLLLFVLVSSLSLARASDDTVPGVATQAYEAGRYADAARIAAAAETAPALAFAARALIADAITRPDGLCADCLRQAETLAKRASAIDPRNVEAHLQEAVALGFLGRSMGVFAARRQGLAERVREQLDKALAIDPGNPWAKASLGAWNLEIVSHAGSLLANLLYGAKESVGLELYRSALRELPEEALLHYQFALTLLALDQDGMKAEARQALERARGVSRQDALTTFTRERAAILLDAMRKDNTDELRRLVLKFQGYPASEP
jgi:tetratricopeptide (TPR) repeat protein